MIGLIDALTLATTKLKTRRLMTIVTILITGLLFGVVFTAIFITAGIIDSLEQFNKASQQSFLVKVIPADLLEQTNLFPIQNIDQKAQREAQQHYLKYLEEQKSLARRQGLEFDEKTIKPPIKKYRFNNNEVYEYDQESPVLEQILLERQKKFITKADNNLSSLKKRAAPFHPVRFYQASYYTSPIPGLKLIASEQENWLSKDLDKLKKHYNGEADVRISQYRLEEDIAIKNLILPFNSLRQQNSQAIPVVITAAEAQILFGDKLNIPAAPTNKRQLVNWVEQLRSKINGQTYRVCYRNASEQQLLDLAVSQQLAGSAQANSDFQISYSLPKAACQRVTVQQDHRTAKEKQQAQARIALAKQLGNYQEPQAELLTFQVVGVFPPTSKTAEGNNNLTNLTNELLTNQIAPGAVIPLHLYRQLTNRQQLDRIFFGQTEAKNQASSGRFLAEAGFKPVVVEFSNYHDANNFIDFINGSTILSQTEEPTNIISRLWGGQHDRYQHKTIDKSNYKFYAQHYGRNFVALPAIIDRSQTLVLMIIGGIVIFTLTILSLVIAKVMYDSRHETAVLQAVGARRFDIAKIYLLYSLIIAIFVTITATISGIAISLAINSFYADDLTALAKLGYSLFNHDLHFKLLAAKPLWLSLLVLIIVTVSLLAAIPPLIYNIRRNPIQDLKDIDS